MVTVGGGDISGQSVTSVSRMETRGESYLLRQMPILHCIVVGDSGVGKTSLVLQATAKYACLAKSPLPTIGVDIFRHDYDGVSLQFRDTAGQERFAPLTAQFYRQCEVACVVFRVDRRSSFDRVPHWVDEVRRHAQRADIPIVLVGNGVDCALIDRWSTPEEAWQCVQDLQLDTYVETSAMRELDPPSCPEWVQEVIRRASGTSPPVASPSLFREDSDCPTVCSTM
jgi:small GTP-binding protein